MHSENPKINMQRNMNEKKNIALKGASSCIVAAFMY